MAGLDQVELLPSFQRLDCCLLAGKKAEEQVVEVEVVVVVVDLLVVELF